MAFVDFNRNIIRCFNSTLAGSAASTPPCGLSASPGPYPQGSVVVDFGFEIDDRFVPVTYVQNYGNNTQEYYLCSDDCYGITNTQVVVIDTNTVPSGFYVLVF
jgi:hypothetical protein